jgi:hypothetical protein
MTRAIASGYDHNVKTRLAELDQDILDAGVHRFTAREVCKLRKAPTLTYAIPPLTLWDRMIRTLREVAEPLREAYGKPLRVLNGYRDSSYNTAVGGAKGSRHLYFEALDLTADDMPKLRRVVAVMYLERAAEPIGVGLYRGNIHIDYGYRRRHWGSMAAAALDEAREHVREGDTQPIDVRGA